MKHTSADKQLRMALTILVGIVFFGALTMLGGSVRAEEGADQFTIRLINHEFAPAAGLDPALAQEAAPTEPWHGLIQLDPAGRTEAREALEANGVELLQYLPENTWLAAFPGGYNDLLAIDAVRWIGAYQPAYKLDPVLQDATLWESFLLSGNQLPLAVQLFADADWAKAEDNLATFATSGIQAEPAARLMRLTVPANQLMDLAALDAVAFVSIDLGGPEALLDSARQVAGVDVLQAAPYSLSGNGINVVIFDEGIVDATHPDLAGRVTVPYEYTVSAHSTHVGGTVAGDGTNSEAQGYAPYAKMGFAPLSNLISYSYANPIGRHDEAINTYGADISQNSWGFTNCTYFGMYVLYAGDFDEIITGRFGPTLPIIFAAGNTQGSCDNIYGSVLGGPSTAKNVITVGSTNDAGNVSSFSALGPTLDGRLKPEIVAVGQNVVSTCPGGVYCNGNGTSMAAPGVSGSAALLLEAYRNSCTANVDAAGVLQDPLPSTMRALLVHAATDLNNPSNRTQLGPDFASGYGQLNTLAAYNLLPYHVESSVADGATVEYQVTVNGDSELKATLAWDDPKAANNAAITLINDLDIELVAPNGQTVYGPWLLDPTEGNEGNPAIRPVWTSGQTAQRDDRNVIEQVKVDNPADGVWTIRIIGSNVPQGPQSFSLTSELLTESNCSDFAGSLAGSQTSSDVNLGWSANPAYSSYEVYRSTSSPVVPGDGNTTLLNTIDATGYNSGDAMSYADSNIINGSAQNYYYAIRGVNSAGASSELSNVIAKLSYTLQEGLINQVSWPINAGFTSSVDLQNHIEANSSASVTVRFIEQYDEIAQSYRLFSMNPFQFGTFAVTDANSYLVAVQVPDGNSVVWTMVGSGAGSNGTLLAPEAATSPALYYGQLAGATTGTPYSYIAWTGTGSGAPAEILTEDGFNTSDGTDQGYQNDYWLVNLNNFSSAPTDGATINILFGETDSGSSSLWSHTFTFQQASDDSNQGTVAAGLGGACPGLASVGRVDTTNYISYSGSAGTYLLYRSQQASDGTASRSNGRYQYIGSQTISGSSGSFTDITLDQSWYIIVPADGSNNINGCHSIERGTAAPTAIQLDQLGINSTTMAPAAFLGLLATTLLTLGLVVRQMLWSRRQTTTTTRSSG
ncbi:MAG: S8 family serine peptidase [Anaerolineales bacterium]|nr:S8 family serine peptidase [Anaerolineales bacterium]